MADPYVRQIGAVDDIDGIPLPVGVDYSTVRIGNVRLTPTVCDEFAALFMRAHWEAAQQDALLADAAADDRAQRVAEDSDDDIPADCGGSSDAGPWDGS